MKQTLLTLTLLLLWSTPSLGQESVLQGGFENGPKNDGTGWSQTGYSGTSGPWVWETSPSGLNPLQAACWTINNVCADPKDAAHTGNYFAKFSTFVPGSTQLYQIITIPTGSAATLSFWAKITTTETTSSAYDKLYVGMSSNLTSANMINVMPALSNLDANGVWTKYTANVSNWLGLKARLQFNGINDGNSLTTFIIDDVSVTGASTPSDTGHTYVLPSSAHASGANGAFYTTDLSISNRGTTPASVGLKFIGNNQDGRNATKVTRTIAAGQSITYTDILSSVFGVSSGWGGIIVTSDSSSLKMLGQTSTPPPDGHGSFGQSVPGMVDADFGAPSKPLSLIAIRQDDAYHTNLVLMNVSDVAASVTVQLLNASGAVSATVGPVSLLPQSTTQLTGFAPSGTKDGVAVVSTTTTGAVIAAYAVVVDNVTSDPRTILP
jgi:hypothetical protein